MNKIVVWSAVTAAVVGVFWWASQDQVGTARAQDVIVPQLSALAADGEAAFQGTCAACHGADLAGTNQGPPLLHAFYKPGHHGDFAIVNAVQNGSRQHHWQFGDMPAQEHITEDQLVGLIAYIREIQRANGIE
ncbi:MAG TPA: cytochrome c [Rhodobacteraceae bacterium]|nr:cytochrome c [Paracoccaceae bacterium]